MAIVNVLGDLDPAQFLAEYWQKKPLLVRGALAAFPDPLSPEELAGLACESEVEARLVLQQGGRQPWEVRHGPFSDEDFRYLPETHWTLLVQDADKHYPALAELLEPFRFIPDWRIDDLMVSYAPLHGSVGPHRDNYDVFLIQGQGRRRWQLDTQARSADKFLADTELHILADFRPDKEWELEPGDLLYLPPGVAHYGVALGSCLTYSVGFRTPRHQDLLSHFADFLLTAVDPEARYSDPDLSLQANPGEISNAALAKVKQILHDTLASDDALIESWFGRFITEPKPGFGAEAEPEPYNRTELTAHLQAGGTLERNPGSRFAYRALAEETWFFTDGQEFALGPSVAPLAPLLCQYKTLTLELLRPALKQPSAWDLLLDLVNEGYLVIYEDEDED